MNPLCATSILFIAVLAMFVSLHAKNESKSSQLGRQHEAVIRLSEDLQAAFDEAFIQLGQKEAGLTDELKLFKIDIDRYVTEDDNRAVRSQLLYQLCKMKKLYEDTEQLINEWREYGYSYERPSRTAFLYGYCGDDNNHSVTNDLDKILAGLHRKVRIALKQEIASNNQNCASE